MLVIPLSDFTRNVETWLDKASQDNIVIEKDGKPFLTVSKVNETTISKEEKKLIVKNLFGILKGKDVSLEQIKNERLQKQ